MRFHFVINSLTYMWFERSFGPWVLKCSESTYLLNVLKSFVSSRVSMGVSTVANLYLYFE